MTDAGDMTDHHADLHSAATAGHGHRQELLALAAVALLFFAGLGRRQLWKPDEPRVAGIAAEMARTGDSTVPRLNGRPFLEKPPAYLWGVAGSFRLLGESAGASRLTSALAAIAGVLLVFRFVRRTGSGRTDAMIAGTVLATSANYWDVGRRCLPDMQLSLCIAAAMYCGYEVVHARRRHWLWALAYASALAAGLMTKGLVAVAIPASALTAWLLWRRERSPRPWLILFGGAVLALLPVCGWLVALWQCLGSDAVYTAAWTNNIGRFTGSTPEHIAPFYYYATHLPPQLLPWLLFAPAAVREWRRRQDVDLMAFLLCWFVVPLLLLSLSAGKRGVYLLPLYPAAALLLAPALARLADGSGKTGTYEAVVLTVMTFLLPVGALALAGETLRRGAWDGCAIAAIPALGMLGAWGCMAVVRRNWSAATTRLLLAAGVSFIVFGTVLQPWRNERHAYRSLFREVARMAANDRNVCLYQPRERLLGAAVFYLGHSVRVAMTQADLLADDTDATILCRRENWPFETLPPSAEERLGAHRHFLIVPLSKAWRRTMSNRETRDETGTAH